MNLPTMQDKEQMAGSASGADVTIEKPYFRWLFGGFGFQHSEANFLSLMPDDFRDQRVLKTFAELSPTFGRVYEYDSAKIPDNPCNDLQGMKGTVKAETGAGGEAVVRVELAAKSMIFLTTDYVDRTPDAVRNVRLDGATLRWRVPDDPDHRYCRVFHKGRQIASTVVGTLDIAAKGVDAASASGEDFRVVAVDRWCNASANPKA